MRKWIMILMIGNVFVPLATFERFRRRCQNL